MKLYLLYGIGGSGKTQIALKFLEGYHHLFAHVFWIDASNSIAIKQSLHYIASERCVYIPSGQDREESVLDWIGRLTTSWLMIYDNADGNPEMVEKFLPNCSRGNVLITSRNPNLRTLVEPLAYCEIEEMEVEDAIELLLKAAYLNVSLQSLRQKARKIVSELCCLALAIDQAGTAIGSGICQLDDYLARYAQSRDALLNDTTFKGASRYNRCVYTTWDISYEDIVRNSLDESDQRRQKSNSHAILVIRLFAFFHNVQIPEELFSRAAVQIGQHRAAVHDDQLSKQYMELLQLDHHGDWNPLPFREAFRVLGSLSLVRSDTSGGPYSMHPLIHNWSRNRITPADQHTTIGFGAMLLASSISSTGASQDSRYHSKISAHVDAIYAHLRQLPAQKMQDHEIYRKFAEVYRENGMFTEQEDLAMTAYNLATTSYGSDHTRYLSSKHQLAIAYRNRGKWQQAELLVIEIISSQKECDLPNYDLIATCKQELAWIYDRQGDWEKAEVILRQILLDRDDTRIDTISSLYVEEHLAELLYRQHRTEGRQLMEAVLIRTQREYGAEHPFTLRVMQKLAVLLKDSDPQKAVSLASTASDKLESGNGSDHPYTLRSKGTTFESQLRDSRPEAEIVAPAEGSEEATIASSNVADEAAERIDQTFEDNYDGIDWLRLPRLTKPLTTSRRKPSWIYQHGYCVVLR
ncbi:unnamed protein product [Alternaria alternata]